MQRPLVLARTTALITALGGALLLPACGGDDSSAPPTVAPTAASTAPTAAPTDTADLVPTDTGDLPPITPLDTSDLPTTAASTSPAGPTTLGPTVVAGCPAGNWYLSQTELDSFYDTVGAMSGVAFSFTGDAELDLRPDGTFAYVLTDFRLLQEGGGGVQVAVSLVGTIEGTYEAAPALLTTTIVNPNVTAEATVDGEPVDATEMLAGFLGQFPFDDATYRCLEGRLELDVPVLSATHTLLLTPAD